jgi:[ribosomal protein S5]-alanine N-acetyltransferase
VDAIYRPGVIREPDGLRDDVVLLRRWSHDDLGCIEEASRDPVIPNGTTVPNRFSEVEGRAFIERQWGRAASGEGLSLAIIDADAGSAAGLVCLMHRQQPGVVGLGYWIVASRRRRGLARGGVILLSRWALGLGPVDRIEALVDPTNDSSIRVLEGAGFEQEAKLRGYFGADGARHDALLYSLISTDIS